VTILHFSFFQDQGGRRGTAEGEAEAFYSKAGGEKRLTLDSDDCRHNDREGTFDIHLGLGTESPGPNI
jgi:hypothetical protein